MLKVKEENRRKIFNKNYNVTVQCESMYDFLKRIENKEHILVPYDYAILIKQIGLEKYNYDNLKKQYDNLNYQHNKFKKECNKLISEYKKLININTNINITLKNYKKEYNFLKNEYELLKNKYKDLEKRNEYLEKENIKIIEKSQEILSSSSKNNNTLIKKQRQITDKQIEEIKELKRQGLSYRQIKKITKWSTYTISHVVNGSYDK